MRQLTEHVFAETGFAWANVGAAVTERGIVLIDCPVRPSDSRLWQKELRSLSPLGVRYLISTDYHGDHVTGSAFIKEGTLIAPERVYEEMTQAKHPFFKEIFMETLRDQGLQEEAEEIDRAAVPLPELCFEEGLILHLPPLTFEMRRMGGHTPACSVVYIPEEKVLFGGDVVIDSPCPGMREANAGQWIRALEWIEALPVDRIVPGHGEVCGKEVVRRLKQYLSDVRETMRKCVRAGRAQSEAVKDPSFERFFWTDTSKGAYWAEQRKETFRKGLEKLYEEVKREGGRG